MSQIGLSVDARQMTLLTDVALPAVFYNATDTRIAASDYAGSLLRSDQVLRVTRPISDGTSGFETVAPGARARFGVLSPTPAQLQINVRYTGLVNPAEPYDAIAPILVGGIQYGLTNLPFVGPTTPAANVSLITVVPAGLSLVEVIYPYCASFDFQAVYLPLHAQLLAPPPRPADATVYVGDSITQGLICSQVTTTWPWLLSVAQGRRCLNLGYGGRQAIATDMTAAAIVAVQQGAGRGVWMIGHNDCLAQSDLTNFGLNIANGMANWLAGCGLPLTMITPTWTNIGGTIPIESYRQAIRDAVAALADPRVTLVEGAGPTMPSGTTAFTDGTHFSDFGAGLFVAALLALGVPA